MENLIKCFQLHKASTFQRLNNFHFSRLKLRTPKAYFDCEMIQDSSLSSFESSHCPDLWSVLEAFAAQEGVHYLRAVGH